MYDDKFMLTLEGTDNPFRSVNTMLGYYEHNILHPNIPNIGIPCITEKDNVIPQDRRHLRKIEEGEVEEAACGSETANTRDLMETMQKIVEMFAQKEGARGQNQQGPDIQQQLADQKARIEELAEQNRQLQARLPPEAPPSTPPQPPVVQQQQQQQQRERRTGKCPIL